MRYQVSDPFGVLGQAGAPIGQAPLPTAPEIVKQLKSGELPKSEIPIQLPSDVIPEGDLGTDWADALENMCLSAYFYSILQGSRSKVGGWNAEDWKTSFYTELSKFPKESKEGTDQEMLWRNIKEACPDLENTLFSLESGNPFTQSCPPGFIRNPLPPFDCLPSVPTETKPKTYEEQMRTFPTVYKPGKPFPEEEELPPVSTQPVRPSVPSRAPVTYPFMTTPTKYMQPPPEAPTEGGWTERLRHYQPSKSAYEKQVEQYEEKLREATPVSTAFRPLYERQPLTQATTQPMQTMPAAGLTSWGPGAFGGAAGPAAAAEAARAPVGSTMCPPGQFWDGTKCRGAVDTSAAGLISAAGGLGPSGGVPASAIALKGYPVVNGRRRG